MLQVHLLPSLIIGIAMEILLYKASRIKTRIPKMIPRIMAAIQEMSHLEIRAGDTLVRPDWAKFDKSFKIST